MDALPRLKQSFFFGRTRLDGLTMEMVLDNNTIYCDLNLGGQFEGEAGSILSGMAFGVMDVMMWYAILVNTGRITATRKATVELVKPLEAGRPYRATGKFTGVDGRDLRAEAYLADRSGEVCVEANALFRDSKGFTHAEVLKGFDFTDTSDRIKNLFQSLLDGKERKEERAAEQREFYPYGPL